MKVLVTNIQRFSLHDGPGIRTTIFFKGCNLKCPWCCNPENIDFNIQEYVDDGIKKYYGYEISLEELEEEILKDRIYYENGGGVTFSGGECLWQFKRIEPLLKKLKMNNINICIETALTVPREYLNIAIKYVDEFYVDVKILDKTTSKIINGNPELFISNYKKIISLKKSVVVRIPIVKDFTYTEDNINLIVNLLKNSKPDSVQIFRIHNLAQKKYETLNIKSAKFENVSDSELQKILFCFKNNDIKCEII